MKTVGIIGGTAPESTIEYYRLIIAAYREATHDGSYPPILINSINMKKMLDLIAANELVAVTEYLRDEVRRLAQAGADLGLFAANTPHLVFKEVQCQSPIPLVSIVEATCERAKALGIKKAGLFGTRFTMQGHFYQDVFARAGITLVAPAPEEQSYIHAKYMGELVDGVFLAATRDRLLTIVRRLREKESIEGLVLGGTELPLILREPVDQGIPFLDTTRIHVERVVTRMLSDLDV